MAPPSPGEGFGTTGRAGTATLPPVVLITGTDTGIGKTTVSGLLLKDLRSRGVDAAYWKPVETDCPGGPSASADVAAVRATAGHDVPASCSQTYAEPLAPAVAAAREGRPVEMAALDADLAALRERHQVVLIEGAGGVLVELAPGVSFRELAQRWEAAVLIVVGNRLGCLNHAALTVEAVAAARLPLLGWVLNNPGESPSLAKTTNLLSLRRRLGPETSNVGYGTMSASFRFR